VCVWVSLILQVIQMFMELPVMVSATSNMLENKVSKFTSDLHPCA